MNGHEWLSYSLCTPVSILLRMRWVAGIYKKKLNQKWLKKLLQLNFC